MHNSTPLQSKQENYELAFIEIFKKQNSHFNKIMEAGQENTKNLKQMFNKMFELFW